ncbi:TPA: hypothetical protein NVL56_000198 [Enterobacter hormaechei subsp. xiangfangensis]|nr:hypothetical protein [Enterobacter hormaechei subsp. xiangfangensis]
MSTITKEQLIASAHARIEFAEMMLSGELEPLTERTLSIELELARSALASLEAEPVGEIVLGEYDDSGCHPDARVACIAADGQADWGNFKDGTRLYAAPPLPAEIDERDAFNAWNNDENLPIAGVGAKNAAWLAWQARAKLYSPPAPVSVPDLNALDNLAGEMLNHAMNCERRVAVAYTHCAHRLAEEVRDLRAAMLQGAEPVTTAYKLPPHVYRELVNSLRDTAVKYQGCQQLREQLSRTLQEVIEPAAPQQE